MNSLTTTPQRYTGAYPNDSSSDGAWCRFTVRDSAKRYRALAIYDNGTEYTAVIPAQ